MTKATEDKAFDDTTTKGQPKGLFRDSMTAIRTAHFQSNKIRAVLVVAGLFTDVAVYREVIGIFYVLTKALQSRLDAGSKDIKSDAQSNANCVKLLALGYTFAEQYEKDLQYLYGDDWKACVDESVENNDAARDYLHRILTMDARAIPGAVFVLWGALIIGGGAVAMPKVRNRFGADAIHVFQDVTGPKRQKRREAFIATWDSLTTVAAAEKPSDVSSSVDTKVHDIIVDSCRVCMQGNNDILQSLARNPWWLKHIITGTVALSSIGLAVYFRRSKTT